MSTSGRSPWWSTRSSKTFSARAKRASHSAGAGNRVTVPGSGGGPAAGSVRRSTMPWCGSTASGGGRPSPGGPGTASGVSSVRSTRPMVLMSVRSPAASRSTAMRSSSSGPL
ncbi:hypothetical protein ADZ36_18525 [Streptomyces fradiae]|uniref:Uncharacterized protein n=1 Tax=Streptomyces fradiae TaxID=1906 RepID=A0ACC4WAG6_STRFR|nr:hypothetical protein ADZ36_18525 [Streptomyces fradiae]